MKKNPKICNSMSRETVIAGWAYFAFELLFLPGLLLSAAARLGVDGAVVNFVYYLLNFVCVFAIFREFLGRSLEQAAKHMLPFLVAVLLGTVVCWAGNVGVGILLARFSPSFSNVNDAAITAMTTARPVLMGIGTVLLVPAAEECLFRGLIFSQLRKKSGFFAYALSVAAFCSVHVVGFVGSYPPVTLALCALQYIPAGVALAWAYDHSGTIVAPILIHTAINAIAFLQVV